MNSLQKFKLLPISSFLIVFLSMPTSSLAGTTTPIPLNLENLAVSTQPNTVKEVKKRIAESGPIASPALEAQGLETVSNVLLSETGDFEPNGNPVLLLVEDEIQLSLHRFFRRKYEAIFANEAIKPQIVITTNLRGAINAIQTAGIYLKAIITDNEYPRDGVDIGNYPTSGAFLTQYARNRSPWMKIAMASARPWEVVRPDYILEKAYEMAPFIELAKKLLKENIETETIVFKAA